MLALLVCAPGAAAEDVAVSSDPPGTDFDPHVWTRFTTVWNRSQETGYTPRELRASLPGVTTADVAWVLAERGFNEAILADAHWSAEHLLLEEPGIRLAGKAVGEVDALGVMAVTGMLPPPTDPVDEDLLWSSLEETLGDVASLRGTLPIKELLWLRIAQDLDERAWQETDLTAHDLLSRPDYGLVRKIFADGLAEAVIACVGMGSDFCHLIRDTTMDWRLPED